MCILMKCRTVQRAKSQVIEELILLGFKRNEINRSPSMYMYMYNVISLSYTHLHIHLHAQKNMHTHTLTDRSCDVLGWDALDHLHVHVHAHTNMHSHSITGVETWEMLAIIIQVDMYIHVHYS